MQRIPSAAAQKAPVAAIGFQVQCNKWVIIVCLLLVEVPERTIFMQNGVDQALRPSFELTNVVRIGVLELFRHVAEKFSNTFNSDQTHNLIVRLWHNVLRTGLHIISISYSHIALTDVAKLRLDSANPVADAESIVSKAIQDGAIHATIDHANGWMVSSKETGDIYSTNEPQICILTRGLLSASICIMRLCMHSDFHQILIKRNKVLRRGGRDNSRSKRLQSTLLRRMTVSFDCTVICKRHFNALCNVFHQAFISLHLLCCGWRLQSECSTFSQGGKGVLIALPFLVWVGWSMTL